MLQVKRDKLATVPHHRRPPMALKVRSTQALSFEGPQGFSVQLLSLQDTFASVSRLADGGSRPSSPISQVASLDCTPCMAGMILTLWAVKSLY